MIDWIRRSLRRPRTVRGGGGSGGVSSVSTFAAETVGGPGGGGGGGIERGGLVVTTTNLGGGRGMIDYELDRTEWLHGEARCPGCGLSLDPERDLLSYDYATADGLLASDPFGGFAEHRRCGRQFKFTLTKARKR